MDFCTPRGWNGCSLCDVRKYRGRFSLRTAKVVSESPPAVLVPFGGTSGNSDGEMWLFVDADGSLKKTRIAMIHVAESPISMANAWNAIFRKLEGKSTNSNTFPT